MKTILLTRHSETETPETDLYKIFSGIEHIVEQNYNTIKPKIGPWSKRDLDAWLIENTLQSDLLITANAYALKVLKENGWRGKTIFKGLGGLARGGADLRGALPYLSHSDAVWLNATADLEIYKHLVVHDGTEPEAVCIPYNTDTQNLHPLKDTENALKYRNALGFERDDFVLIYTGNVTIDTNVHATLEAVAELRHLGYPVKLIIAGEIEDTPFAEFQMYPVDVEEKITDLIEAHGISEHVTRMDKQDDNTLNEIRNAADAYINLTLHHGEHFSLPQINAMGAGLPVVGTAWGGLKDTIPHNQGGFRIDTWLTTRGVCFDAPAVIDALKCLIENKDRYRQFSESASRHAMDVYNEKRYVKDVTQLIEKTLEHPTDPTEPKLTDLGTRFNERFVRKEYPLKYSKQARPPHPVYDGLSDPDYMALITPYISRTEHKLQADSRLFRAMTGHLNGEFFVSEDLLYSIRIPISSEEAEVINQLQRWQGVPRHTLNHPDALLTSLIEKGVIGISKEIQ